MKLWINENAGSLSWARVGGRLRVQVRRPDTARFRMNRFRGLR